MVNSFFDRLLPMTCLLCGITPQTTCSHGICSGCLSELPRISTACLRCGLPLPSDELCGSCQRQPPAYSRCISPLLYQAPVNQLISQFKYHGKLAYGRLLSNELIRRLGLEAELSVDLIVPVPLHWRRRWSRGFNQAEIIGDELHRALGIPLHTGWLVRTRATPSQQSLSAAERRKNLRAAFSIKDSRLFYSSTKKLVGADIALVDDVVTTGATVSEISHLLLSAGAASIQVWCIARTP